MLRVLGSVELGGLRGAITVGGPKERALLAFLALRANELVSEATLIDALWADDPPRTASRTLHAYLSRVRKALHEAYDGFGPRADDGTSAAADDLVALASQPGGWILHVPTDELDVSRVEALVALGHESAASGDHFDAALTFAEALREWRGEPLSEVGDVPWALAERARLSELRMHVIEERLDAELACGRAGKLMAELESLCRVNPVRERLWAMRMLALYRVGRQADARRAYQDLRATLRDEVGLLPSPALTRLEQLILDQDSVLDEGPLPVFHDASTHSPALPVTTDGASLPGPLTALRAAAFVGRDQELEALNRAWERATAGSAEVVFLSGEPGIGKTALAVEHALAAADSGAVVLFGRCDEMSVVPFQPFVEALGGYVARTDPTTLRQQIGDHAGDVALLVPELGRYVPGVPDVEPTGAETERYRLFEAVPAVLSAIGREAPVLLVLDDLHWAERPTLLLLRHLIRRRGACPLLVVGTYRDTDLVRTHPMAEALAELRRASVVTRVPVRGLTAEDVLQLVTRGVEPGAADHELAKSLWQETEGSPLFLREMLRHLAETGMVVRESTGRWRSTRRIGELGIPEGVREVIGFRLSRLSEDANIALRAGSVLGRELRIDVLEQVTGLAADALLDALEEATTAGVLDEVPGVPGRYTFTHALLRQTLYEELSITRRVRLHQHVGEALERIGEREPEGPDLAELAHHFSQAAVGGTADKAIDYGRRAAQKAAAVVAYEDAARLLATALEVADDAGAPATDRAGLLLAIGDLEWRSGRADEARRACEQAIALVGDRDADAYADAALGIAGGEVRAIWVELGRTNDRAIEVLERALTLAPPADSSRRASLLAALARELHYKPGTDEQRAVLAREAIEMSRRVADSAALARILCVTTLAIHAPETAAARAEAAAESRQLAEEVGDRYLAGHAAWHHFLAVAGMGRWNEALASFEEGATILTEVRDPVASYLLPAYRGGLALLEGRLDEAERLAQEEWARGRAFRDQNALLIHGGLVLSLAWYRRRGVEVLVPIPQLTDLYPVLAQVGVALQAALSADVGLLDVASAALARVDPATLPRDPFWAIGQYCLARAVWRTGHVVQARAVAEAIRPFPDYFAGIGTVGLGPMRTALAWCETVAGNHDAADEHFHAAAEICERHGWRVPLCEIRFHHAVLCRLRDRDGDRDRVVSLLAEAEQLAVDCSLDGILREIRAAATGDVSSRPGAAVVMKPPKRRAMVKAKLTGHARSAIALVTRGSTDDELVRRFGPSLAQRALFRGLAASFQPEMAFGFEGDISIELHGAADDLDVVPDWWTIEVRTTKATARPGRSDRPTTVMHATIPHFVRLASGEFSAATVFGGDLIEIEGDVMLAARFLQMFGAVPPIAVVATSS